MTNPTEVKTYYWVIVYERSVAMFRTPLTVAVAEDVYPTPRYLLGFPTLEEARDTQECLLTGSDVESHDRLESFRGRIRDGEMIHIEPARVLEVKQ
jgi:hypothetical protein